MAVAWQRLREPLLVLGIAVALALLSQRWAGLDTPDSSFYTSLGLFGSEVTDRAPVDSYFWTRLGVISPVHALTSVLGTWPGFLAFRLLLMLTLVGGMYVTLRRFAGIASASFLTAVLGLSSVVLSYLGNPYLTGSVLAGTSGVIAAAMFDGHRGAAVGGATLGWLVMVNPPGALLAGTLWLVLRIQARTRLLPLLTAAGAAAVTFGAFWVVGRIMFPGLDWFDTVISSGTGITLSNFASADVVWLRDVSLIVPAAILVTVVVAWVTHRSEVAAQRALVISLTSVAFMLVFSPLMGGIALEAPMYQAMLWPPALIALGLVTTLALPERRWTKLQVAVGILAFLVVLVTGRLDPGLGLAAGWLLAAVLVAVFLLAGYKGTIGAIAGLALLLTGAQLLQNSREDLGLYYLSPYSWAFAANPVADQLSSAVATQEWLLSRTTRQDSILTWVDGDWVDGDRELYVAAGMQLWGENRITLEPTLTDPDGLARLSTYRPTVLALYGQSMDAVLDFWASIPADNQPSPPECLDFPWSPRPDSINRPTQGHACLTRLTWTAQ